MKNRRGFLATAAAAIAGLFGSAAPPRPHDGLRGVGIVRSPFIYSSRMFELKDGDTFILFDKQKRPSREEWEALPRFVARGEPYQSGGVWTIDATDGADPHIGWTPEAGPLDA